MKKVDAVIVQGRRGSALGADLVRDIRSAIPEAARGATVAVTIDAGKPVEGADVTIGIGGRSLAAVFAEIASALQGDTALFITSHVNVAATDLASILRTLNEQRSAVAYATVQEFASSFPMPELEASEIVSSLSTQQTWPLPIVLAERSLILGEHFENSASFAEVMLTVIIEAIAAGEATRAVEATIAVTDRTAILQDFRLGFDQLSRLLQVAIKSVNIEELFPGHAWSQHQSESAAASYHALAALFIRWGDYLSATRCLDLSEELEESPRALGLKGLIAMLQGETLGAVAHMVSSLQRYETRKKSTADHYLYFVPRDLKLINSKLSNGLEALNRRENESALEQFAAAVFNFDPFYGEFGVDRLNKRIQ